MGFDLGEGMTLCPFGAGPKVDGVLDRTRDTLVD